MTFPSMLLPRRSFLPFKFALVVFLAATCLRVWTGGATFVADARAQLPDPGKQRQELVTEVRRTNQLLTDIIVLLKSGTLHVRVERADNQAD